MNVPRLSDLKIVIIDSPYDCFQDEYARELWARIMALKIAGYRSEYDYGVLPVDASDFYACHMAIFRKLENGQLVPLLVCKNISLERHKLFSHDEFMLVDHFQRSAAFGHLEAIRDLVRYSETTGKSLHYFGSYTTDPSFRGNPLFSALLKEVFLAMHVNFHLTYGVDISTCAGAKRFKVDKMLETWGYERLKLRGQELPDYKPACIFGNDAVFFAGESFSEYALEVAQRFRDVWESRLHLGRAVPATKDKKAA